MPRERGIMRVHSTDRTREPGKLGLYRGLTPGRAKAFQFSNTRGLQRGVRESTLRGM
jgi:hypothetical protein